MNPSLSTPTTDLFMIGSAYAKRLEKLDIRTAEDLLHHYPSRYNDFRLISKISHLQIGETATIQGQIISFENIFTKYGKKIQKIIVADETGQLEVIFFNQTFLSGVLKPGLAISLSGKAGFFNRKITLISPEYEIIKTNNLLKEKMLKFSILPSIENSNISKLNSIHTGRLVPIYPETYGVSSKWLRSRIKPLLEKFLPSAPDWLPEKLRRENNFISLTQALKQIHFPENENQIEQAKKRLAFDELFIIQIQTLKRAYNWKKGKKTKALPADSKKIKTFIEKLPFKLTTDQKNSTRQILKDINKTIPMNRLLQGDVGCGKTVVAAIAAYAAFLNKKQTAIMAPTEILALQHYQTFKDLLEPYGLTINLVTGSKKTGIMNQESRIKNKKNASNSKFIIHNSKFDILIGTHALIYNKVNLNNIGLIVIDEQHRFGVEQRAKLAKKSSSPHTLIMTATPIPRTVALTLYGNLDLSVITQMPLGRKSVKTWVVPSEKRNPGYQWIKKQIKEKNSQAFIVCPFIEESDKELMQNIKAAKQEFKYLSEKIFPNLKLGLLHGKIKPKEKDKTISDFRNNKLDILVATPVVEVGIDIPNASIILIEGADRFGLAALHQLRGRVGRRNQQAYCLLFASEKNKAYKRLKLMENYNNGMQLAEMDLKFRGSGELYGTAQHGFAKLKLADLNDINLIEQTKKSAGQILDKCSFDLSQFPLLKQKLQNYTIKEIEPN